MYIARAMEGLISERPGPIFRARLLLLESICEIPVQRPDSVSEVCFIWKLQHFLGRFCAVGISRNPTAQLHKSRNPTSRSIFNEAQNVLVFSPHANTTCNNFL